MERRGGRPVARTRGLVVKALQDEVLVYDLERHQAHRLNGLAAAVWRACDGTHEVTTIAAVVSSGDRAAGAGGGGALRPRLAGPRAALDGARRRPRAKSARPDTSGGDGRSRGAPARDVHRRAVRGSGAVLYPSQFAVHTDLGVLRRVRPCSDSLLGWYLRVPRLVTATRRRRAYGSHASTACARMISSSVSA
jgi:Coenzyme PQQ synthesis protein D (PqqD)